MSLVLSLIWGSFWGRIVVASLIGLAALKTNNIYQRHVGAEKATAAITKATEEAGKAANAQATKAHDTASKPGAADRLRRTSCRDCK